ncbi:hypothetical protein GCM10010416_80920 [Streptomyces caniferus]
MVLRTGRGWLDALDVAIGIVLLAGIAARLHAVLGRPASRRDESGSAAGFSSPPGLVAAAE